MMLRYFLTICWMTIAAALSAQLPATTPPQGIHHNTPNVQAFTNCTLVLSPGEIINNGVLVIRDGIVENGGHSSSIPPDAIIHDLEGAWVFPGFIDPYAAYGIQKPKKSNSWNRAPQYSSNNQGPYSWNQATKPEYSVVEKLKHKVESATNWRRVGFTTVNAIPLDGIFRGSSTLINLGNHPLQKDLISPAAAACMSFRKGVSNQAYPSSLMGSIALIRQTLLDAAWYSQVKQLAQQRPGMPAIETNLSLEALNQHLNAQLPLIFECDNWQDVSRAARIAEEFGLNFTYKTKGDSYLRLAEIKALNRPLIVPLTFPKAQDVSSLQAARSVNLAQMLAWEKAPMNPGLLAQSQIPFALTTYGLTGPREFWTALKKALQHGLTPAAALAALTTTPAAILHEEKRLGTLYPGKIANFIICDGDIFTQKKSTIYETWVRGDRYINKARPSWNPAGQYRIAPDNGQAAYLLIGGKPLQPKAKIVLGLDTLNAKIKISDHEVLISYTETKATKAPRLHLDGLATPGKISGTATNAAGKRYAWTATRLGDWAAPKDKEEEKITIKDLSTIPAIHYPNKAFGFQVQPIQETVIIQNATVWTNMQAGILTNADVVLSAGKVQAVGRNLLVPPGATIIDGTGKHVTPGIIDEHSHIAISRGVNEGSHAITAEVSISDV
ncbi:MAG TPA: amidohydrolase, partial [Bacteroidetes bacterium]|nr:amidohydrolase [Bacteroidota bacterium]